MTMHLASIYARARGEQPSPELEQLLASALAEARRRWPFVHVTDEAFAAYAAERVQGDRVAWTDLYLACAAASGDPAALRAFEEGIMPHVRRSLARSIEAWTLDDALQIARRDLLALRRIAQYDGRGPLQAWTRVAVLRRAVRAKRQGHGAANDANASLERVAEDDPELSLLKLTTREAFRNAFIAALESLDTKERLVLRQHLVDGLSIDEIGGLHRVHRATAARWINAAKDGLLAGLRKSYSLEANVSPDECESAIRLIQSQFDISVKRLLVERS